MKIFKSLNVVKKKRRKNVLPSLILLPTSSNHKGVSKMLYKRCNS